METLAQIGFLLDVVDTVGTLALLSAIVWKLYSHQPPPPEGPNLKAEMEPAIKSAVREGIRQGLNQAKRRRF